MHVTKDPSLQLYYF